jgi:hypothetical protein
MTNENLKTGFTKWLLIVIATLLATGLVMVANAHCQTNIKAPPYFNHAEHESVDDLEEDIRFKSVIVIATEPTTIFWKKESKDVVNTGSFSYDDRSKVGKDIKKGCYIAIYCVTHSYLYALYPCKE